MHLPDGQHHIYMTLEQPQKEHNINMTPQI